MDNLSELETAPFRSDGEYGGKWAGLSREDWPLVAVIAAGAAVWAVAAWAVFG